MPYGGQTMDVDIENSNREVDTMVAVEQSVAQTLFAKRDDLIQKLQEIENSIIKINEEYSSKLNELQWRRKPLEEALFHIEALLKLDGHKIDRNATSKLVATATIVRPNTSITDAAFTLLQRIHQPTHYKEITKKLQDDNVHIPGKNPSATLLSRISRDKRFKRAKERGVYALSAWRIRKTHSRPRKKLKRT
jgi:hypothetical protein